jgi:glycosyltransferase involved in cell wall biosynthesis
MPSRPPRGIAVVVHNLDALGGMERQAARLAESLAARGIEVTIVTTRTEPPLSFPPRPMRPLREPRGSIEIIRAPAFGNWTPRALRLVTDLVVLWAIMRRRRKIDAVYAVQFSGAIPAAVAARVTGLPSVVKFAGGGEHGDFRAISRREDASGVIAALRGMDRFVIISDEIRTEAEAAGIDPARFVRIRNGVDTRSFSPEGPEAAIPELGPRGKRKVVLFVGRLGPEKRVDVLLRSFARVLTQVPEARLALAGEGPRLGECITLARELGIESQLAFLGPRADVDALHRAASVFVLPSVSEGLPNALLEALACGTPCVATDIPGTRDVVTHGREALLVPPGDTEALAAAIVRLLEDRELAQRLATAGRRHVMGEFDMQHVADRYVALFSELVAVRRPQAVGDLVRQARFAREFGWRLAAFLSTIGIIQLRDSITRAVVSTKRLLGIEGEIMVRLRRDGGAAPAGMSGSP